MRLTLGVLDVRCLACASDLDGLEGGEPEGGDDRGGGETITLDALEPMWERTNR